MMPNDERTSLRNLLGTVILRSVAGVDSAQVLRGQAVEGRKTREKKFRWFKFYGEEPMSSGLPGHRHEHPEMAVVLSGRLIVGIDQALYESRAGDWLVFSSQVLHGECYTRKHQPYELLWLLQTGDRLCMHRTSYQKSRGFRVLDSVGLESYPRVLQREFAELSRSPWSLEQARPQLVRLVSWCLEQLSDPAAGIATVNPWVERIQASITGSLGNLPSVVELANSLGLSPNYLSDLFHRHTGQTIRHYMRQQRITEACRRLRDPSASIKQVAYALGFADLYHFSHVFRRTMGISPRQWRRQHAGI